jgi:xanthine dehydrogenase YagR molybdenum-binding subunit
MASASYPAHSSQGNIYVCFHADDHAVVKARATDLGTGIYIIITQVAVEADSLGLGP